MTGITKDELMQMAGDAGAIVYGHHQIMDVLFPPESAMRFTNAILERAAVESERTARMHAAQTGREIQDEISHRIRALKINTGD